MAIIVQKLSASRRADLLRHLQKLPADDRRLRFGTPMNDAALEHYVAGIDFGRDKVFGVHDAGMELVGMAHLALDDEHECAELGLSVEPAHRGKGCGFTLLERGKLSAITLGYTTLFMHCLGENKIMMHLAKKAGLKLIIEQGDVDAHLKLPATNYAALAREAIEDQIALADLVYKRQFDWLFAQQGYVIVTVT
jgi:RimJ/RimL family protein N-acetyltransferase